MKKALVILFDKVEELEALAPVDILRRARIDVTTAALGDSLEIIGRSGIAIDADELFDDIANDSFDAVVLPGGPGVYDILEMHPEDAAPLKNILARHIENGKICAAICAAPLLLSEMKLLAGRKCTAHDSVIGKLENAYADAKVVRDGNVITSQGAGTAIDFALEILASLAGGKTADDIATSIRFKR